MELGDKLKREENKIKSGMRGFPRSYMGKRWEGIFKMEWRGFQGMI